MKKKYLGYLFILGSVTLAFFRGKRQGELDCIDFNVLPFIPNALTIILCAALIFIGIRLIQSK